MKSPSNGLAARMNPEKPNALAVLRIEVNVDVLLKKPVEKLQMTMAPFTCFLFSASGC